MSGGFKGWLTRRANGLYLLTYYPPVITKVGSTEYVDCYAIPGDPVAYNNLCPWSVNIIWGVADLEPLQSVSVYTLGKQGSGD